MRVIPTLEGNIELSDTEDAVLRTRRNGYQRGVHGSRISKELPPMLILLF